MRDFRLFAGFMSVEIFQKFLFTVAFDLKY